MYHENWKKNETTFTCAKGIVFQLQIVFPVKKEPPVENFLQIMYIEGWGSYIRIYEKDKKFQVHHVHIGYMGEHLPPCLFVIITKGWMVNMLQVKKCRCLVLKTNPQRVLKIKLIMYDGKPLIVTGKHVEIFLKLLQSNPHILRLKDTCKFLWWFHKFVKQTT